MVQVFVSLFVLCSHACGRVAMVTGPAIRNKKRFSVARL